MNRNELNFVLKQNSYLEGGTKEACVKAREFLQYAMNLGNQIYSPESCVSAEEFMESVKLLVAYAFQKEDEILKTWYCNLKCKDYFNHSCLGEYNICNDSDNQCPYFMGGNFI